MSDSEANSEEQPDLDKLVLNEVKDATVAEKVAEPNIKETITEVEEVLDTVLETKKPKKERTEKQKAAFERARKTRAANIARNKATKEANKKPLGRPKKVKKPEPESSSSSEDSSSEEEPEIVFKKKPKVVKKVKQRKQKVVYITDDSSESESDDEIVQQIQRPKKGRPVKATYQEDEYSDSEEYTYSAPTSMSQFYNFV